MEIHNSPTGNGANIDRRRSLRQSLVMRWHVAHGTVGRGHLYQGRFKSSPIPEGEHFLTAARYVERNAMAGGAVYRAEAWRWGSLWARREGGASLGAILSEWPVARPPDWL